LPGMNDNAKIIYKYIKLIFTHFYLANQTRDISTTRYLTILLDVGLECFVIY